MREVIAELRRLHAEERRLDVNMKTPEDNRRWFDARAALEEALTDSVLDALLTAAERGLGGEVGISLDGPVPSAEGWYINAGKDGKPWLCEVVRDDEENFSVMSMIGPVHNVLDYPARWSHRLAVEPQGDAT